MNKTLTISVFLLVCIFFLMQTNARAQKSCLNKITKEEMEILLKDAPPMMVKRLQNDPEVKKQQIKSLKEMLAVACASEKEGLTNNANVIAELENVRIEIIAANYDREINRDKGLMLPFGAIEEARIKKFWEGNREAEFQKFLDSKIAMANVGEQLNKTISEEDIRQARDYFAKTRIYAEEAGAKWNELSPDFKRKTELSVKLQQAQYLSRIYADKVLANKAKVTDEEVQAYIAAHSEFDTKALRDKAEKILQRAKAGEDFAKLAREFSEDPGSKENGGLYANVPQGQMVVEFEQAALALEPGQIAPALVESKYGFHIIKLEKKGVISNPGDEAKQVYDVRHILILTTIKDPENPLAQPMPIKDFVLDKLQIEKEKLVLEKVVAENPVEVAEDFEIPKISDEQIQQKEIKAESLPKQIKSYLDRIYKGWKLSPSEAGCGMDENKGFLKGNFNSDKKFDYAVKLTRGKKGYLIAFLALPQGYKAFVLRHYTADEASKNFRLSIWKKGETYNYGEKSVVLKYDAPAYIPCGSDAGGIHLYRNGKFAAY
jgi:parvulin-like peptidyl-prolyl isomerase